MITKWRLVAGLICFTIMGMLIGTLIPVNIAEGAGNTTMTINIPSTNYDTWYDFGTWGSWSSQISSATPRNNETYTSGSIGWSGSASNYWIPYWFLINFDVSSIPAGVEIVSIKLKIWVYNKIDENPTWSQYYAAYTGQPVNPANVDEGDGRRWYYGNTVQRISDVHSYGSVVDDTWLEFDIHNVKTGDFDYVTNDSDDKVAFYILTTNQGLKYQPSVPSGTYNKSIQAWLYGGTYAPCLEVEYVTLPNTRTVSHDANDSVDSDTDGTEVVDNVTWGTPRAMYSDEDGLYLLVEGDSGALFTGNLVSESGEILTSVDDSVRVDGNYDWWISGLTSLSGFVRAEVVTDNVSEVIRSKWAYIAEAPDTDERTNEIYSLDTSYPQYDYEFDEYIVNEGDKMFVHWKTNIDGTDSELEQYNLVLKQNGVTEIYNESLYDMWGSYYYGTETNAENLLHWRYAIFTMDDSGAGYNDYDGLVINLDKPLVAVNKGFYQPLLIDNTDNSTLTETHSAYWYLLNDTEGIIMNLDKSDYTVGDTVTARVQIGIPGRVSTYLPDFTALTTGSGSYSSGGTILNGSNTFPIIGIAEGSYDMRFQFEGSEVENYIYIHDIPFSVLEAGAAAGTGAGFVGGLSESISTWLQNYGLDNPIGHYVVIIIGMVALFLVLYKSALLRVVVPLLLFGLAILSNWIDPWIIVLLALGAGLTIYGLLRKKTVGGE